MVGGDQEILFEVALCDLRFSRYRIGRYSVDEFRFVEDGELKVVEVEGNYFCMNNAKLNQMKTRIQNHDFKVVVEFIEPWECYERFGETWEEKMQVKPTEGQVIQMPKKDKFTGVRKHRKRKGKRP